MVPYKVHWSYGVPLPTHTSVAIQKLIIVIDVRSTMFCSNVMENNCNFEFFKYTL